MRLKKLFCRIIYTLVSQDTGVRGVHSNYSSRYSSLRGFSRSFQQKFSAEITAAVFEVFTAITAKSAFYLHTLANLNWLRASEAAHLAVYAVY